MQTRSHSKYGWLPQLPDHRDHKFTLSFDETVFPPLIDLRPHMPPVYDQGQIGSCTANGIAAAIQYDQIKNKNKWQFEPSRLFIYYQERVIEGTVDSDSGAMIRDGVKACATIGACADFRWPYDVTKFTEKPSNWAYWSAGVHKITNYASVGQNLNSLKSALLAGFPVVFGFTVYSAFESAEVATTGMLPMPGPSDTILGGHCVLIVGYDDSKQSFIVRNSWGSGWGLSGYFYMFYSYVTNPDLASDFWVINTTN